MKEMNSETHSCTHSFASLDTLAVVGSEFFMMRETFAICRQSTIPTEKPLRIQGKVQDAPKSQKQEKSRKSQANGEADSASSDFLPEVIHALGTTAEPQKSPF